MTVKAMTLVLHQTSRTKKRNFKGYGVLDRRGKLLWGSLMPKAHESEAYFHRHNPSVDGHEMLFSVVKVRIEFEDLR